MSGTTAKAVRAAAIVPQIKPATSRRLLIAFILLAHVIAVVSLD